MKHAIVFATSNRGKISELRELLARTPVDVFSISDIVRAPFTIVEDCETFAENALKKATVAATKTGMLSLADDSGLEVDALGGAPGVRSARFAHERATDGENNAALIAALGTTPDAIVVRGDRIFRARFRCALALVDPYGCDMPIVVEGACEGHVTLIARGQGGFGYDPLFVVDGFDRTMAELTTIEKNAISHRARAFVQIQAKIAEIVRSRNVRIANIFAHD